MRSACERCERPARTTQLDRHDLTAVRRAITQVPGCDPATTGLVVASLSGLSKDVDERSVDLLRTPQDIIESWLPLPSSS
jgi:hypothetical protein